MTPNRTRYRILNLLGLPKDLKQRKLRNQVNFEVEEIFNMTQIVSPQTNLRLKLLVDTNFGYSMDILNFVEAIEN